MTDNINKAASQLALLIPYISGAIEVNDSSPAVPLLIKIQKEITEIAQRLMGNHEDDLNTPLNKFVTNGAALTCRTINCLVAEGINTIGELLCWCEHQLLRTPNLGRKSLNEIMKIIQDAGYKLGSKSMVTYSHGTSKCSVCEHAEINGLINATKDN